MTTLLLATRNAHKVDEIRAILGPQFQYLTLNNFPDAPEVVEDAPTFAGNALKKASGLARWLATQPAASSPTGTPTGCYVLADDSGLEVDALGGAPGVHSARFAALDSGQAGNSSSRENNAKLLRLVEAVPVEKRAARFRCSLALTPVMPQASDGARSVGETVIFEGVCPGRIELALSGQGGFGYDPLFTPEGYQQTFGELGEAVKNGLSHRAQALAKAKAWLDGNVK